MTKHWAGKRNGARPCSTRLATTAGIQPGTRRPQRAEPAPPAGLAGGLYAHLISFVSPDSFNLAASIEMLFMIVLGGLGSVPGSVVGAAVVAILPEYFRVLQDFRLIVYSIAVIGILIFAPSGVWGLAEGLFQRRSSSIGGSRIAGAV